MAALLASSEYNVLFESFIASVKYPVPWNRRVRGYILVDHARVDERHERQTQPTGQWANIQEKKKLPQLVGQVERRKISADSPS